ncbi:amidase [Hirsutella rhossiliensis]|uniref:amidase n=1 Tax=Hirsutella rhossiliensis TaxID=111463 RepID=A0A9P8MYL6_9HYPO|nr:amidase domain-containing protein [Hirsutella rhossiliensis]KAH0964763.1 amidase domain-containing protein [Hirsutella rhossiliensis]
MAPSGQDLPWEEIGARKREALLASIPPEWRIPADLLPPETQDSVIDWPETSGWLTTDELVVTSLTASELVAKLAAGHLKSEAVTTAFCKRAAAAHQLTNCLSETCFDRAIAAARARDEHLARTGKPIGPFHGLPISLKDSFYLRGLDATLGFASHVGDAAESDSALAELLEGAGAVLYVKTNVSTAMMIGESVNNVFGRTVNPRNRQTTSGGSSGGESALIAFRGSPLGVGTDIGGSLRVPAACTGIFTLRPSVGRFPVRSTRSGMPGQEAVHSVNGPMAGTLRDLELYCRGVLGEKPWLRDPRCLPFPWRSIELAERLRIAVMWHDGMVRPTPPVSRVLKEVASKLRSAGHDIVEWDPVDQRHGADLLGRMFVADGGTAIRREVERTGEPWRPELEAYRIAKELGVFDMWKLHAERTEFQNRYLDRWNTASIDAILCPTMAFNTVRNGYFKHVGYTGVFNVLDYSCLSFVTGLAVDKDIDTSDFTHQPLSPECKAIHEEYDAALMHGLPVSLQLVARRLEEEKVLAMGQCVLEALSSGTTGGTGA